MHRVKNESGGGEGNDSWTRFSAPRGSNKYIKGVKHRNRKVPRPRDCIQFADPLQPAYRSLSGGHSLRVFICPTNAAPTTLRLYPCDDIDTEGCWWNNPSRHELFDSNWTAEIVDSWVSRRCDERSAEEMNLNRHEVVLRFGLLRGLRM